MGAAMGGVDKIEWGLFTSYEGKVELVRFVGM
jgi:hypothetical protein